MLTRLFNLPLSGFIDGPITSIKNPVIYIPVQNGVANQGQIWAVEIEVDGFSIDTYSYWQNIVRKTFSGRLSGVVAVNGWPIGTDPRKYENVKNFLLLPLGAAEKISKLATLYPDSSTSSSVKRAIYQFMSVINASGYLSDGTSYELMRRHYNSWTPMFRIIKMTPLHTFDYISQNKSHKHFKSGGLHYV